MIRDGLAGFNVAVFAGQLYRDWMTAAMRDHVLAAEVKAKGPEAFAVAAFAQAAAFLRVAKRHDLTTAEPNGLPADVELEVAGDSR